MRYWKGCRSRIETTEAFQTSLARVTEFPLYDRLGRLVEQKAYDPPQADQTTTYGYDLVGRRTQLAFPDL